MVRRFSSLIPIYEDIFRSVSKFKLTESAADFIRIVYAFKAGRTLEYLSDSWPL